MNSIERTYTTLQHRSPDRVPVALLNFMVTARIMGVKNYGEFFQNGEAMAEGQIAAWKRYQHDVLVVENGTAALAQACGVQVTYQSDTAPVATEPAIKSLDDVDKLVVPDPYSHPLLSEMLKATRIIVQEIGNQVFIMGRADQGPFSLACEIRGMSQFMMDLALGEQAEEIHKLLVFCREVCYRYAVAQVEQGAHCTSIGDSPSGPDLLSPRDYRKYAHPYVLQLVRDLKKKGVLLSYHICGNATPIIADMVGTGAQIIEIDQKSDMPACKEAAKGKSTLLGTVDPSGILANGSPQQVREKSREAIEILGPGGGFILAPGCAMPATTPDENIHALIETAAENPYPL